MRFDIPFYKQEAKNDCAPTALRMVLDYLSDEQHSKRQLLELVDSEKSGATWTIALAKVAAQLGFGAEFYSTSLGINPDNYNLDFYKSETDSQDSAQVKLEKLKAECIRLGVRMEERSLSLDEIKSKLSKDCAAIILLDWDKVKGTAFGYTGHTVPISGSDEDSMYVHNQGSLNAGPFIKVSDKVFEEARKAKGTDEDIVFIHRKR